MGATKVKSGKIHLKRAYDQVSPDDGYRILVERLWPRGLTKEKADVDLWLKEIAPSPELRKWFGHDPQKWQEFSRRYRAELEENTEAVSQLRQILKKEDNVTFVYAARDTQHNSALLLKDYLEESD
jgi:uncharacterized protein YeaO (DUF488 family)